EFPQAIFAAVQAAPVMAVRTTEMRRLLEIAIQGVGPGMIRTYQGGLAVLGLGYQLQTTMPTYVMKSMNLAVTVSCQQDRAPGHFHRECIPARGQLRTNGCIRPATIKQCFALPFQKRFAGIGCIGQTDCL